MVYLFVLVLLKWWNSEYAMYTGWPYLYTYNTNIPLTHNTASTHKDQKKKKGQIESMWVWGLTQKSQSILKSNMKKRNQTSPF